LTVNRLEGQIEGVLCADLAASWLLEVSDDRAAYHIQ
jgi:hypothetical protein